MVSVFTGTAALLDDLCRVWRLSANCVAAQMNARDLLQCRICRVVPPLSPVSQRLPGRVNLANFH